MSTGMLFIFIVIGAFIVFATQAGAKESKMDQNLGPGGWVLFLVIAGIVLYGIWSGVGIAFTH